MSKSYFYAVTLKGSQPSAVDKLHQFDSESDRACWLRDMREDDKLAVRVNSLLAKRLSKTHPIIHTEWMSRKNWWNNLCNFAGYWAERVVQRGE